MSATIDIIAIITPKPGKADRVQEILTESAKDVKDNEPTTLRYHLQREINVDTPTFVMLETYEDHAAMVAHGGSQSFKEMSDAFKEEDLLAKPMQVIFSKPVAGFASRI